MKVYHESLNWETGIVEPREGASGRFRAAHGRPRRFARGLRRGGECAASRRVVLGHGRPSWHDAL